ncbi:MAG TPA: alpha/beta hydrolase [Verrucomicrobiae bacterium]|jgi:predicted alpha/beta hydrolase family esterase|nr:alpha/beta hydrolase [Verrucomicrobiae bacterium]
MSRAALIFPDSVEVVGTDRNYVSFWYHGAKNELRKRGYFNTHILSPPDAEHTTAQAWADQIRQEHSDGFLASRDVRLFGQGLGGVGLLRLLEQPIEPISGAYLVSTPVGIPPIARDAEIAAFANGYEFDYSKIRATSRRFRVFHADDDPQVPVANGAELARQVGVELTLIQDAGHFDTGDSCEKLYAAMFYRPSA